MFSNKTATASIYRPSAFAGISFLLIAVMWAVSPAVSQQESVVLVHAGNASGYGVAYGNLGNIVTALHVVAGRSPITVVWKGKKYNAKIERVYSPADLALLRFASTPPNIPTLKIYPDTPPMKTGVQFWIAPVGSPMDKKETKLDKTAPLSDLSAKKTELCSDGGNNYPALTTNVFRFENPNIRKEHSGSPLTYNGALIGLVDGGPPKKGVGSIWAIPAEDNFEMLLQEGSSVVPGKPCSSDRLYSGIRSDNPHLDPKLAGLARDLAESEKHPFTFKDDNGDQLHLTLDYRATFRDIYDTMEPEDKKDIQDMLEDEKYFSDGRVTLQDLFKQSIDVLLDDETGAVIAIPTGCELEAEKDEGHNVIGVMSPPSPDSSSITATALSLQSTESVKESKVARDWFLKNMLLPEEGMNWVQVEDDHIEDLLDDPESYYEADIKRVAYGDDGKTVIAELYASITINEGDFLGAVTYVIGRDRLTKKQRIFNYLMETCVQLTDFTSY